MLQHPSSRDARAYRVFRLDRAGCVISAEIIPAIGDEEAKAVAGRLVNVHGIELWERGRRLGAYPRREAPAAPSEA